MKILEELAPNAKIEIGQWLNGGITRRHNASIHSQKIDILVAQQSLKVVQIYQMLYNYYRSSDRFGLADLIN